MIKKKKKRIWQSNEKGEGEEGMGGDIRQYYQRISIDCSGVWKLPPLFPSPLLPIPLSPSRTFAIFHSLLTRFK